jgi:TRAP-type transport system periplasmic protein
MDGRKNSSRPTRRSEPLAGTVQAVAAFAFLIAAALAAPAAIAQAITLHGAVQFADEHPFNQALLKFEELTRKYYGKPVSFVLHRNSELGLEKDYFAYMNRGISVDYGIVSPSHMSTFAKSAPLMDMPFLFRDVEQWRKVLEADALKPIAEEVAKKADVMIVGYAGGGVRNLIVNKPVHNLAELKGLKIRVMGAPIQTRTFQAIGASPTVIAYGEIYNAIQTGVIQAAENEALGIEQMKFYEVGPNISQTRHAITVRPICFSGKTFRRLPKDLQSAILRAGKEAGEFARALESGEDRKRLERLAKEGKLKLIEFADRDQLLRLTEPVRQTYAKEVGAEAVFERINAIK